MNQRFCIVLNFVVVDNTQQTKRDADQLVQHEQHTPHLGQLPNEILSRIVDNAFYAIVNRLLWSEPVLTNLQRFLDCLAATEQPLGHYVRNLHLDNTVCTDHQLLLLMPHIQHLETLSIENDYHATASPPLITNTSLQHLSQLTSLSFYFVHLSEPTVRGFGQHCRQLCELIVFLDAVMPWQGILSVPWNDLVD